MGWTETGKIRYNFYMKTIQPLGLNYKRERE